MNKSIKLLLLGVGLISFWGGVWEGLSLYVFPDNPHLSVWTCIIIGILVLKISKYDNF